MSEARIAHWLLKTEPEVYSFADLQRDGQTIWDGVSNNAALIYLRQMRAGDQALIYHTGEQRQAVGLAEVISAPYPDPALNDAKLVVVDLRALRLLASPVSLAQIKQDAFFADFVLLRQARLSVVPVTAAQWQRLMQLAGELSVPGQAGG